MSAIRISLENIMIHKLIRRMAPIAAIALSATVASCGDMNVEINGEAGVPLAELDMSGDPPTSLVLAGPDKVILIEGGALDINVEGDADTADLLRFSLNDGKLAISRKGGKWEDTGIAIVNVTMPAPKQILVAGSGAVESTTMAEEADITIAGSGKASVAEIAATKLEVTIAGSGSLTTAGTAERLELNILGAGKSDMQGLKVERAEVTVAGSGDASFASDGEVEANIIGSGDVQVIGSATCEVKAMGSGTLKCEPAKADRATTE